MAAVSERERDSNRCPHCGGDKIHYDEFAFRFDKELPPKPWYGFDPYSDPDYHGAWVCDSCGKIVK